MFTLVKHGSNCESSQSSSAHHVPEIQKSLHSSSIGSLRHLQLLRIRRCFAWIQHNTRRRFFDIEPNDTTKRIQARNLKITIPTISLPNALRSKGSPSLFFPIRSKAAKVLYPKIPPLPSVISADAMQELQPVSSLSYPTLSTSTPSQRSLAPKPHPFPSPAAPYYTIPHRSYPERKPKSKKKPPPYYAQAPTTAIKNPPPTTAALASTLLRPLRVL